MRLLLAKTGRSRKGPPSLMHRNSLETCAKVQHSTLGCQSFSNVSGAPPCRDATFPRARRRSIVSFSGLSKLDAQQRLRQKRRQGSVQYSGVTRFPKHLRPFVQGGGTHLTLSLERARGGEARCTATRANTSRHGAQQPSQQGDLSERNHGRGALAPGHARIVAARCTATRANRSIVARCTAATR